MGGVGEAYQKLKELKELKWEREVAGWKAEWGGLRKKA